MDLTDPNALEFAILFLVPGFVSIKVWDLLVPSGRRELTATSLDVFAYGAITFALLTVPLSALDILGTWSQRHPVGGSALWASILFVFPAILPLAWWKILAWEKLRAHIVHPVPKPWDYVFGLGTGYWVILHMKDGRRIGGRYDEDSFASSFPHPEQLYLQEIWELDEQGAFRERIERTRGVMVSFEDVYAIEFFDGGD